MLAELILVPFSIGLLGAGHCFGMCGGIVAALSFSTKQKGQKQGVSLLLSYNLGRISSYSVIGLIAGGLGKLISSEFHGVLSFPLLSFISALLIVLLGLYLIGISQVLTPLEKLGAKVWRFIRPLGNKFLPIRTISQGFVVGAIWGWLPCGLVYTAVAYSIAQQSLVNGAVVMLSFGLGTLPALLMGGLAGQSLKKILQGRMLRLVFGSLMIAYGTWVLVGVFNPNLYGSDHHIHSHHH